MFGVTGIPTWKYRFIQIAVVIPQTSSVFTFDCIVHHTVIFPAAMPPTSFASAFYPGACPYLCMCLFGVHGNEPMQAKKEDQ